MKKVYYINRKGKLEYQILNELSVIINETEIKTIFLKNVLHNEILLHDLIIHEYHLATKLNGFDTIFIAGLRLVETKFISSLFEQIEFVMIDQYYNIKEKK